jgi:serine/threonine protein kinase
VDLHLSICVDLHLSICVRPFFETEIVAITVQMLEGLTYLHRSLIVHRDLKCGNLLLMEDGTMVVSDFGVSAQLATTESRCHTFVGSPYWIAPEVIMAMEDSDYSFPADIWSLGITMYAPLSLCLRLALPALRVVHLACVCCWCPYWSLLVSLRCSFWTFDVHLACRV